MRDRPCGPHAERRHGRRTDGDQHGRPARPRAGLRPFGSAAGKAALASNYTVTGGIQTGAIPQSTLLPFAEQQQQALRDAFITDGNLAQLADGLGTTLGAAYQARAHYLDRQRFTSVSKSVADVIAYANSTTAPDSNAGKYFFANATTDGKNPVSDEAMAIFKDVGGAPDPFGRNYGKPAGTPGADAFGDSRPFQTEPRILQILGRITSMFRRATTSITAARS